MATLNFKFVANAKGLQDGIKTAKGDLTGFEKAAKGVSKKIGLAIGAISFTAVIAGLKDAVKAAQDDTRSQQLLAQQLKTTVKATDAQIASNEIFISSLSKAAGIADDNLRPALANAVRGTGSLARGQELLKIALDGSVASGKPLDSVLQALIKANAGSTTALYKLAPQLKATKGNIDDYAKSVDGAAEVGADPFSKMNVAIGEIQENIGKLLLPAVSKFADYITTTIAPALQKFFDDVNNPKTETGKTFSKIKTIIGDIWQIIQDIAKSKGFQSFLGATITLAMTLLSIAKNIAEAFGSKNDSIKGAALGFSTKSKQTLLTDANIQQSAMAVGGKKLTAKQIKKARNDLSGGADGNAMTPWPFATGGIVMPRVGGTLGLLAEAGKPEAVIPLDRLGSLGGGNTYVININKASISGEEVVRAIRRYENGLGRTSLV